MPTDLISAPTAGPKTAPKVFPFDKQSYEALSELERRGSIRPEEMEMLGSYRQQAKAELERRQKTEQVDTSFMGQLAGFAKEKLKEQTTPESLKKWGTAAERAVLNIGLPMVMAGPFAPAMGGVEATAGAFAKTAPWFYKHLAPALGYAAGESGFGGAMESRGAQKPKGLSDLVTQDYGVTQKQMGWGEKMLDETDKAAQNAVLGLGMEIAPVIQSKTAQKMANTAPVKALVGFLTGKGGKFVEAAAKGTPGFERQIRSERPMEDVATTLKSAYDTLSDRELAVANRTRQMLDIPGNVDPNTVKNIAKKWMVANDAQLVAGPAGVGYSFSKSGIEKDAQETVTTVLTDLQMGNVGTKLNDLNAYRDKIIKEYLPQVQKFSQARRLLEGFANDIESIVAQRVPKYRDAVRLSDGLAHIDEQIMSAFNPKDVDSNAIIKRLTTAIKEGQLSATHLQELGMKTGTDVLGEAAGVMGRNKMPDWTKYHSIGWGGLTGGLYVTKLLFKYGPIIGPILAAASSPKLVGEFLHESAKVANLGSINQFMRGVAFGPSAETFRDVVDLVKEYALPQEEAPTPKPEPKPKKKYTRKDRRETE